MRLPPHTGGHSSEGVCSCIGYYSRAKREGSLLTVNGTPTDSDTEKSENEAKMVENVWKMENPEISSFLSEKMYWMGDQRSGGSTVLYHTLFSVTIRSILAAR